MYYPRLWREAPKILYNQADLDNFLKVATLSDWVKSPDPPIDPAEAPKYEKYPKTLYSVQMAHQVAQDSNQEALLEATYHPLDLTPGDIEAAQQAAEQKQKQADLEAQSKPQPPEQPPPSDQFGQPQQQQQFGQQQQPGQFGQQPGQQYGH